MWWSETPTVRGPAAGTAASTAWIRNSLILLAVLLSAACGYQFSGKGELPGGVRLLSIQVFDNRSGETGIETLVANDLVDQFTRFQTVRLADAESADAVLTGTIRSSRVRTVAHRRPGEPSERRITLFVDIVLKTPAGEILWSARDMAAADTFLVADTKLETERNKKSAIASLSERLAERIYYQLTGSF